MSAQKLKQQQANLFSFFRKSDSVPKQTAAAESSNAVAGPTSLPPSAEKKPHSLSTTNSAVRKDQSLKLSSVTTKLTEGSSFPSTTSKKGITDLQDSDDDSFALGKKRRLQKTTTQKQPSPDSASKKQKISNSVSSASKSKVTQPAKKKSTIHYLDEDDDESHSTYSEDVDSEYDSPTESGGNSGSDSFIGGSDDDNYGRKSKKPPAKATGKKKGAATKASIPKPSTITPRKSSSTTNSLPSSVNKTPGAKSSSSTPLSTYATKTPDRFAPGEEEGGNSPAIGSQPPSASKFVLPEGVMDAGKHDHDSFEFLHPEKIRDANNRRPGDIGYNPRTLKVPASVLADQSPAMAQWWQFKAQNMDTVLFFKVGKFYELFHMDADIGFKELDLIYMKGSKAHSGFPEISYGKFASILVSKGYRVARVEQTETPDMLKERNQTSSAMKKDKVVARELCSIMTKGTRTFNHMDDLSMLTDTTVVNASLLMCICEYEHPRTNGRLYTHGAWTTYGICVVDTVISTITVAQFQDDRQRTRLRTMLARFPPTELLLEHDHVSEATMSVVNLLAGNAAIEILRVIDVRSDGEHVSEMPLASQTLQMLAQGHYFSEIFCDASNETVVTYPQVIQFLQDAYERNPEDEATNGKLALRAIGGCLWQLKRSRIDHEIVSMGVFAAYVPPDDQLHVHAELDAREEIKNEIDSSNAMDIDQDRSRLEEDFNHSHGDSTSLFSVADVIDLTATAAATDKENKYKDPNAHLHQKFASAIAPVASSIMILDETTLSNLEILHNTFDQSDKHSLWQFINHSITWGGARLLKSWLCHPLFAVYDIALRQEAVQALLNLQAEGSYIIEQMHKKMRALPDLERLLLRVHANGLKKTLVSMDHSIQKRNKINQVHPDHRAIFFESSSYTIRKIKDFADIITGLEVCVQVISISVSSKERRNCWAQSRLLHYLLAPIGLSCTFTPLNNQDATEQDTVYGTFPLEEVAKQLRYFRSIFDEQQAKKTGQIQPKPGINPEYDAAMQSMASIQQSLQSYLQEMKRSTGIFDMVYYSTGKDRYQLEIPMNQVHKVPGDWQSKSQKKTHRRYWTPFLSDSVTQLLQAEEQAQAAQQDTLRQLFATFDQYQLLWRQVGRTMSIFDALCALKQVSQAPAYSWPDIQDPFSPMSSINGVSLEIINGRHPMLEQSLQLVQNEQQCIPNSLQLGGRANASNNASYVPKTMVLTGPNMGGKSTLLRMTCLVALLGQLGCKVPASRCRYSPIDRIFTRLGASDKLLAGQSTFFVEMAETSLLLRAATSHSLCILDELGRGTATYDGTAIAHAVLTYLVQIACPRVIFATHYHLLVEDWSVDPRVQLGHMDCLVQMAPLLPDNTEKLDEGTQEMVENVTFLYRLCAGASPKSYGINVARLAGLPVEVIRMALAAAASFTSLSLANNNNKEALNDNDLLQVANDEEIDMKERLLVTNRVMQGLLEHLVSLAQTQLPPCKTGPGGAGLNTQGDQTMKELVAYAQELYARYQHLYQHHRVDELLATTA